MKLEDLSGKRFGKLVVKERATNKSKQTRWLCLCDCGCETIVHAAHLKSGHTQSCGCIHSQSVRELMSTHGKSKTKLYKVWRGIIERTTCPTHHAYKNYGGRGITLCKEWHDFQPFYEWSMSHGYVEGLSIDRIDCNGNYEPNNCRWATVKEQQNNRRDNRFITYNGETHTMKEWSEIRGIKYVTLSMRINKYGWSIERSLGFV